MAWLCQRDLMGWREGNLTQGVTVRHSFHWRKLSNKNISLITRPDNWAHFVFFLCFALWCLTYEYFPFYERKSFSEIRSLYFSSLQNWSIERFARWAFVQSFGFDLICIPRPFFRSETCFLFASRVERFHHRSITLPIKDLLSARNCFGQRK